MNPFGAHFSNHPTADMTLFRPADCAVCLSRHASTETTPDREQNIMGEGFIHNNSRNPFFQPGGTSRRAQKSFFSPAELSDEFKNHFSARRNSPTSSKIIFQAGGTLRRVQKSFFKPAELSDEFKNHFSSRRNFPPSSKIIFRPGGTSRRSQKSFFSPAELPAAPKIKICLINKFNNYDCNKDCKN
jgi:hypothetical protein